MVYSKQDISRISERLNSNPDLLEYFDKYTSDARGRLYIQKTGLATWSHYFVCPRCGVGLVFDYYNNERFTCPNCHHTVSGEPYLGAWWNSILNYNTTSAFYLALAYRATGREDYLSTARNILLGYADNYANYEVHGGIPYNNPGRFAAQVLSDAHPICYLANAYALIKDFFTSEERSHIEDDMFREAAKHQIKYMTPQLHNHEVVVCSSIAAIGLVIDDDELVRYALDVKYGLKYQLDHSYLEDGLWFEGALGYHYFSLHWFMRFEMMAKNTGYSLLSDPHYRNIIYRALIYPTNLHLGEGRAPRLNDSSCDFRGRDIIYEYAYSVFGTDEILSLLAASYDESHPRHLSEYALIHGVDALPDVISPLPCASYVSETGSGLAIVYGEEGHSLLFKAMPYGGEHDHYDRLAISYHPFGKYTSGDFGTAGGYGSPLHYGYFKNTASHNTVVIDGENMPPCDTVINEYAVNPDGTAYLDAETLPPEKYEMLDSFTIKQWNDEAYRGVRMRRIVLWQGSYFVDIFRLHSENTLRKEWVFHVDGERKTVFLDEKPDPVSKKGAQTYLQDAVYVDGAAALTEYSCDGFTMALRTLTPGAYTVFAKGPNNPASSLVSYHMLRSYDESPLYVNLIESYKNGSMIESAAASVDGDTLTVTVKEKNGRVFEKAIKI